MTDGQYRAIVAYLNFWTPDYPQFNIDNAISDIGITDTKKDVIYALSRAGWDYNEETGQIKWLDDQ